MIFRARVFTARISNYLRSPISDLRSENSMTHPSQPGEIRRLLEQAGMIQSPCDLDLLVYLHRHPRTLLTSEQLAGFVGYSLKDIAKALDTFLEAGLLERTAQKSTHAAR